ncbi:MAG: hypothetical protein EXR86_03680 [Gammaproteobacteria bacterium]|nr:hypothetical protein [Gammaproteobacteria bacterium]
MNSPTNLLLQRLLNPILLLIALHGTAVGGLAFLLWMNTSDYAGHLVLLDALKLLRDVALRLAFVELPTRLTPGQSRWILGTSVLLLIAWVYVFVRIVAMLRDPLWRKAFSRRQFTQQLQNRDGPFLLICGYGEIGSALVALLHLQRIDAVVIDCDPAALKALEHAGVKHGVPALLADARKSSELLQAGLRHPLCTGLAAVTDNDEKNVEICMAAVALNSRLQTACHARSATADLKCASSETLKIVDPFDVYCAEIVLAIRRPQLYMLHRLLADLHGDYIPSAQLPPGGLWLVCASEPLRQALAQQLSRSGISNRFVESAPSSTAASVMTTPVGSGTAPNSDSIGLIVSTDSDPTNLAIARAARAANPAVFIVARQNNAGNAGLFAEAGIDITISPSQLIARRIVADWRDALQRQFFRSLNNSQRTGQKPCAYAYATPRLAAQTVTASRTVRVMGPTVSCGNTSIETPSRLTSPGVERIPTKLLHDAGRRIEPPQSEPRPTAPRLAATAAPVPALEPPGSRVRS